MRDFAKNVISLIKAGLTDESPCLFGELPLDVLLKFALNQQIVSVVFAGLAKLNDLPKDAVYADFAKKRNAFLHIDVKQHYELERISAAFKERGIDFMPLKGAVLKGLYPSPDTGGRRRRY